MYSCIEDSAKNIPQNSLFCLKCKLNVDLLYKI